MTNDNRGEQEREGEEAPRPADGRDGGDPSIAEATAEEEGTPGTREQQRAVERLQPFFEGAVLLVYVVVGFLLLGLAVASLGYALVSVPKNLEKGFPQTISVLVSELLLVLILVEVLRTILTYISTRSASIRPFLVVAAISSVRRILSIGAELSVAEDLSREEFTRAMVELGAEGFVILVAAIALYLLSRREGGEASDG